MQVNTDVLIQLLQPVPFVAGLPAPGTASSTACETTHGSQTESGICVGVQGIRADTRPTVDISPSKTTKQDYLGESSRRGALETNGIEVEDERSEVDVSSEREGTAVRGVDPLSSVVETVVEAQRECPVHNIDGQRDNRHGKDESSGVEVLERRAAPVVEGPAATLAEALDGIANGESGGHDGEGKRKSSAGAKFYSYDETHQVLFIRLLSSFIGTGKHILEDFPLFDTNL